MLKQEAKVSPQAYELHKNLVALIEQRIDDAGGVISFSEYMQLALYAPQLGYYQNPLSTFGAKGDFITAPEISPLFALCLAKSLTSLDKSLTKSILELGAGSGRLASDLLLALQARDCLPDNYFILEPSASLQAIQRELVDKLPKDIARRVVWLSELPKDFVGSILANEVLDAIPFELVQKVESEKVETGWKIKGVSRSDKSNEKFKWQLIEPADYRFADSSGLIEQLPTSLLEKDYLPGYMTEVRPLINSWIKSLSNSLEQGIVMLLDYGYPQSEYYHPQRQAGSLRCFSRHQANANPLELAGLQDITAHVDFTQVAKQAVEQGMDVIGFTSQAGFLLENGILQQAEKSLSGDQVDTEHYNVSRQIQTLLAPGQMGELIKVIGLSKQTDETLGGFSMQDQLVRL